MTCTHGGNIGQYDEFDKGKMHGSDVWDDDAPDPEAEARAAMVDAPDTESPTSPQRRPLTEAERQADLDAFREEEAAREAVPDGEYVPDGTEGDETSDDDDFGIPPFLREDADTEDRGTPRESTDDALKRAATPLEERANIPSDRKLDPPQKSSAGRRPLTMDEWREQEEEEPEEPNVPGDGPPNRGHFREEDPERYKPSHKDRAPKERNIPAYARHANPAGKGFNKPKDRIDHGRDVMAGEALLQEPSVLTSPYVMIEVLFCVAHMPRQRPKADFPMVNGQRTSFQREVWRDGRFSGGFAVDPGSLHLGGGLSIVPDGVLYAKWARLLPMLLFTHARMYKDTWVPLGKPSHILSRHFPGQTATGGSTGNLAALQENLVRLVSNHMQLIHNHQRHKRLTVNSSNVSLIKSVTASAEIGPDGNPTRPVVEAVKVDDAILDDSLTAMVPVDRELLFRVANNSSLMDALLFIVREGSNVPPGKKRRISWKDIQQVFYPDAPTLSRANVRNRFRNIIDALRHHDVLGNVPIYEYQNNRGDSCGIEIGHVERIVPRKSDRNRMLSELSKSGKANARTVRLVREHNEAERAKKDGGKKS